MGADSDPWWVDSKTKVPLVNRIVTAAQIAWQADSPRRERLKTFARTVLNRGISGIEPDAYNTFGYYNQRTMRIQVSRSMIDAVEARVTRNRPKPTIITQRGNYTQQQRARRLDQFLVGVFLRERAHDALMPEAFRDAMIFGDGFIKVSPVARTEGGKLTGRVLFERIMPWELFVDEVEAYYGWPRTLYQIHNVDRAVLKQAFPERAGAIEDATSESILDYISHTAQHLTDRLQVIEAWRLPSAPDAGDGRHVISLKDVVLHEGEWAHQYLGPFAHIRWSKPPFGWHGQGLIETSQPIQNEINALASAIQAGMYWNSRPVTLVESGADIEEGDLDNDIRGSVIRYRGTPPIFTAPQAFQPEIYNHLNRLIQLAMETEGVSELSVASRKPAGLQSGKALLDFADLESERFVPRHRGYERLALDLGELTMIAARDLDAKNVPVEVTTETRRFRKRVIDKIKWKEVAVDRDQFEMQVYPTSSLPTTPGGRRAAVESMFAAGFLTREQAMELMDLPDTDAVMQRELAPYEIVLHQIESILEDGVIVPPMSYQDLGLAIRTAQNAFLRATIDEVAPAKLDLLSQFIEACDTLIEDAKRAAMAEAQGLSGDAAAQIPATPSPAAAEVDAVPGEGLPEAATIPDEGPAGAVMQDVAGSLPV